VNVATFNVQEHRLLHFQTGYLYNVHPTLLSTGKSPVDVTAMASVGRPYGRTAILFQRTYLAVPVQYRLMILV